MLVSWNKTRDCQGSFQAPGRDGSARPPCNLAFVRVGRRTQLEVPSVWTHLGQRISLGWWTMLNGKPCEHYISLRWKLNGTSTFRMRWMTEVSKSVYSGGSLYGKRKPLSKSICDSTEPRANSRFHLLQGTRCFTTVVSYFSLSGTVPWELPFGHHVFQTEVKLQSYHQPLLAPRPLAHLFLHPKVVAVQRMWYLAPSSDAVLPRRPV